MKKITKKEQMNINGGAHYHWRCYYGSHNYYSIIVLQEHNSQL